MTIYAVDVHHVTHTCPADPDPHVVESTQRVVHVTPGGPCRAPVTIRLGGTATVVACSWRYPASRQCGACRVIVTVQHTTVEHIDPAEAIVHVTPGPTGPASDPCAVCRQPLAAVLAPWGHHVLCHPRPEMGVA